ncbi:SAV_6107 family HEPN domain-containing protein [Nakamurella aerolata]|nr:SAV_6107 family HEPN domain-containing protein [Nakamurella aerolata]
MTEVISRATATSGAAAINRAAINTAAISRAATNAPAAGTPAINPAPEPASGPPPKAGRRPGVAPRRPVGSHPTSRREPRRFPPVGRQAQGLLGDAGRGLGQAMRADSAGERYAAAHLAALRAAAALLATRARPGRGRIGNAWDLLARVAPDLAEWAAFFAAGASKRQLAESGITRTIGAREADDMLRQAAEFLELVEVRMGPERG